MILVDTSAWIDFFQGKERGAGLVDRLLVENQVAVCGPVITEIHRGLETEKDRKQVIPLLEGCRLLRQPDHLWEEAGTLGFLVRKRHRKVRTVDLLIACYALAHEVPLLTFDSDFRRIRSAGISLDIVET
jgi:predicted nucleic acid-binding protein